MEYLLLCFSKIYLLYLFVDMNGFQVIMEACGFGIIRASTTFNKRRQSYSLVFCLSICVYLATFQLDFQDSYFAYILWMDFLVITFLLKVDHIY